MNTFQISSVFAECSWNEAIFCLTVSFKFVKSAVVFFQKCVKSKNIHECYLFGKSYYFWTKIYNTAYTKRIKKS